MKLILLSILCSLMLALETNASFNKSIVQADSGWYHDYDVKFYKIDLNANDTTTSISGNVTILSQVSIAALDTFKLDLYSGLTVDSVYTGNQKIVPVRSGDVLKVPLPKSILHGHLLSVTVFYKGTVLSNGFFSPLSSGVDHVWNIPATWTLSEPFGAKYWFPCKEYLPDKADSAWIFITVPKKCKAGANGILTDVEPVGNNKVRYEWKTRYPIAFYLLSFAVANYQDYSFYTKLTDHDSVLVQNFVYNRPGYLEKNKALIDQTDSFLKFYSSVFGIYPFWKEKYGHCLAPLGGGMEHQTMTYLSSFEFLLVSHELSHQWFGDMVTCATWQDIWINEGFASYAEYLALDKLQSHANAVLWMVDAHRGALSIPDGSVFVPAKDKNDELRIFSTNLTYKKGGAILHSLRYELDNDDLFFNILREFLKTYKDSVASAQDFLKMVNLMSNDDYSWFMNQWYYGQGFPKYDVSWKYNDHLLTITSKQQGSAASTPFFKMHFDLKLISRNGDTILKLYQDQPQKVFSIPINMPVDSIIFDPDEWLLKQITIDKVPDLPSFDDYFQVLTNPFSSQLHLQFKDGTDKDRIIRLVDMSGKIAIDLHSRKKTDLSINTLNITPGVYLLYVKDDTQTYIRKVIKLR